MDEHPHRSFLCTSCGRSYSLDTHEWRCVDCGGAFRLEGGPGFGRDAINQSEFSLWRYSDSLPLSDRVSLGEGLTPLVPAVGFSANTYFKLEFLAPTGSFKDRGATTLVSFLKEMGIPEVVEDSSGNSAASLAAYCAKAGLRARIFVPSGASRAKTEQITAFGAELVPIPGPRSESARAAEKAAAEGGYYASHCWHPFIYEGLKTFAYEVAEQLDWRAPDNVVFPVGNGIFILGAYLGFLELHRAGITRGIPRLFAAQAAACAPIVEAIRRGETEPVVVQANETVAEGVRIANPVRGRDILEAIRNSKGSAIAVAEQDIVTTKNELALSGLFVEPTSPVAVAGLRRLLETRVIRPEETTIVPLTGSGLKTIGL